MHGDLADAAVALAWDEQGVDLAYPVLADPASLPITEAVPTWPGAVPLKVVLSPEMEILGYYFGHENEEEMGFPPIEAHAAKP